MKRIMSLLYFCLCFLYINSSAFAEDKPHICDGWISFVLVDLDKNESPQYFLRLNDDNTTKIISRRTIQIAQNVVTFDLANEMMLFAKSQGKTAKAIPYTDSLGKTRTVLPFCWIPGTREPDRTKWPKDNTGRAKNKTPKPPSPPKDPNAPFLCTQRLVYYLLGQDPKEDRQVLVFDGTDRKGKRKNFPGPITAAQSAIRQLALEKIKQDNDGLTVMLVDDPPATCVQE
jgi:hypothetical protein